MRIAGLGAVLGVGMVIAHAGCSGSSSSSCSNIAGQWSVSGCASVACTVSQNACTVRIVCSIITYSGTVSGQGVDFTEFGVDGSAVQTCHGTLGATTIDGTCISGATTCTFSAVKQ